VICQMLKTPGFATYEMVLSAGHLNRVSLVSELSESDTSPVASDSWEVLVSEISKNKDVRVAEVLQRLKEEVREQRLRSTPPVASTGLVDLEEVRATHWVNPHLPIAWPNWPPGILPKAAALTKKVVRRILRWYINPIVEQQNEFNAAVLTALEMMTAEVLAGREEMRHKIQNLKASATSQNRKAEETSMRLGRMERYVRQSSGTVQTHEKGGKGISLETPVATPEGPGLDYFRLESRYRPPSLLKERQRSYLKYFTGCHNVLDIGCGRGEFVQLLIQEGIGACGVDLDADTAAYAQEQGLPVQQADALAYLEELPDSSLDGVFMAQVVEHLTPSYLVSLLELCYRKMKPDAPLVAETINPVCLWALTNWYLIDPTHVRPVHPDTLRFALESTGFWQTEVQYLSPVPERDRLAELVAAGGLGEELRGMVKHINRNVRQLNEFLYGCQEYVVIARRIPDEPEPDSAARDRQEEA